MIIKQLYPKIPLTLLVGSSLVWISYYLYFGYHFFSGSAPFMGDEFLYFADAKAFALDNRWASAYLIDNKLSMYGQFGAHGFSYLLLYGSWLKLFPIQATSTAFVLHILCLLLSCLSLFSFLKEKNFTKWIAILLLLSNVIFALYTYSYMVEVPQALFAVLASLQLITIYRYPSKFPTTQVVTFIIFIFILTSIRATWILWLIGLVPLTKNIKQLLVGILLFLISIIMGFAIFKLSHAPYDGGFIPQLFLHSQTQSISTSISFFIDHLIQNCYMYFRYFYTPYYFVMKYLIVVGGAVFIWYGHVKSNRFILATGLIIALNWLTIIVWYDTFDWRDIRVLAASYFLGCFTIATRFPKLISLGLLGLHLLFLPFLWQDTQIHLSQKQTSYQKWKANTALKKACDELKTIIGEQSTTVSLSIDLLQYGSILSLQLPLQGEKDQLITYSVFFGEPEYYRDPNLRFFLLPSHYKSGNRGKVLLRNEFFQLIDLQQ